MDIKIQQTINILLNQWSLSIQVAVLFIFAIIFFALTLNSERKVIKSWFLAWCLNAFALSMVMFVLFGSDYFNQTLLNIFYILYAITKIWFAIFMFVGLYQLMEEKELIAKTSYKILIITTFIIFLVLNAFSVEHLFIQISVYLLVGSLFLIGSLRQLNKQFSQNKIILFAFLSEGILFLHHGIILIPVHFGHRLPDYMTHISFVDAINEMVVGITSLFAIALRVNNEMNNRNSILVSNQNILRKLIDVDPLTGLWHRRYFATFLKQNNNGAILAYLTIINLKAINNEWGYAVGDLCLKETAKHMQGEFSDNDGLFRIGGNSFLIILPLDSNKTAQKKVQQLKNNLAMSPYCAPILTFESIITTFKTNSEIEKVVKT